VQRVYFHQPVEFEGKECPEPFRIVITTGDDPDMAKQNEQVFKNLMGPKP
jgi:hypothetical protein